MNILVSQQHTQQPNQKFEFRTELSVRIRAIYRLNRKPARAHMKNSALQTENRPVTV